MIVIEHTKLLNLINEEIAKLSDYDESIKVARVSLDTNTGELQFFPNVNDSRIFKFREYLEQIGSKFDGKYDKIIYN